MRWIGITLFCFSVCLLSVEPSYAKKKEQAISPKMVLVLAAPKKDEAYYANVYQDIIDYQIAYSKAIIEQDLDNVVILVDQKAHNLMAQHLPDKHLLLQPMEDIWIRDFSSVMPSSPLQFRYASAAQAGSQRDADYVQKQFRKMAKRAKVSYKKKRYILDGGNFVSNNKDKIIVTDRFLEDNNRDKGRGLRVLRKLFKTSQIAIIPNDDPEGLAHVDGMVMFTDENTLFVNQYDEPFRTHVMAELQRAFDDITIIECPVQWDKEIWDPAFSSACGVYVNAVVTNQAIYLPQFDLPIDQEVLDLVRNNTTKTVIPIPSKNVCFMGGSARCLVWQQSGKNAEKLLNIAAKN